MEIQELKRLVSSEPFRREMMNMFFKAMLAGYVGNTKKGKISELPGSKMLPYASGPWEVVDTYFTTPLSLRSGGMTIISYEETPVWMMQYFGEYDEEVIPCLKAALRYLYERGNFYGGRGPDVFRHGGFTYRNFPDDVRSIPDYFSGSEEIRGFASASRGWHKYQGGLMI